MSIWIRYTKYEFIRHKEISLTEYTQIRDNYQGFIEKVTTPDKQLFFTKYKFKVLLAPIILLCVAMTGDLIMEIGNDWVLVIFLGIGVIGIKCLGYIFSALSIWGNIQNKKKFYGEIKKLTDTSTDYNNFRQQLLKWNKQQDLGFSGRMTHRVLMSLRGMGK